MIARDSKSYPYLAIAQHYGVDYGEVLKYADYYDRNIRDPLSIPWLKAIWKLEKDKRHAK